MVQIDQQPGGDTYLTIDQLATWIEKNQHKFVFLVYHGGGGGEHICNYLSQQPNLFYKT